MVGGKRLSDEGQEQENDCERKRQKANVMNDADSSTESSESEPKTGFRDHLKTENMELTFASQKWSILVSILLSDKYRIAQDTSWKEMKRKVEETFPLLTSDGAADSQLIQELIESDKVLKVIKTEQGDVIEFVSDDIRHEVMAYFTSNCLRSDEDYKNYIDLTSVDSLLEYARSQLYIKDDGEQCLYLTEEMILFFIQKHGLDALKNIGPISENIKCSKELSYILKVPEEVLEWDVAARSSYVDCALKGTRTIHRARAMLVGCAGAGKTTLLNRLQKKSFKEIKEIQSTVGLEVHEDIFEIDSENNALKDINDATDTDGKLLLSIVDFGGQCAYYACHQVYLSKRAFYILVIDKSKSFDQQLDRNLCDQEGTMFSDWTYGEYIIFWLKSVHTYCEDDTPVITIATHCDVEQDKVCSVYDELLELLQYETGLKKHLDRSRCFSIGFPMNENERLGTLLEVENCLANIARQERWRETIPKDWAYCEVVLRSNKQKGQKLISLKDFRKQVAIKKTGKDRDTCDVLRLYNDFGIILYFNENNLREVVVTDVQWFVDCFKSIITDPMHVRDLVQNDKDWQYFYNSGYLSDGLLKRIWKNQKMDIKKCFSALKYMQRLGLVAIGKKMHYIACMNKLEFTHELKSRVWSLEEKTSVLVFNFKFLPNFFYFRLVVALIVEEAEDSKWTVIEDNGQKCLFKNVACFKHKEHIIILALQISSIQVQIFRMGENCLVSPITLNIRKKVEDVLKKLTKNFHKKTIYTVGFQCSTKNVLEECVTSFLPEEAICGKEKFSCPNHGLQNYHEIDPVDILCYWKLGYYPGYYSKNDAGNLTENVLSEMDLVKLTKVVGPKELELVAKYLGLTQIQIDTLEMENTSRSIHTLIHKIFLAWKRKAKQRATMEELEKAFQNAEREADAKIDWNNFQKVKSDILRKRNSF